MKPNNNICGVGVAYGAKIGTYVKLREKSTTNILAKKVINTVFKIAFDRDLYHMENLSKI